MTKRRILVVEDEAIVAEDLRDTLETLGFEVTAAVASGKAAMEEVAKAAPDLILMDIVLKGDMNGVDTALEIAQSHAIPVVYLTAYADEETLAKAKVSAPFGYLIKPFDERELYTTIEMALYRHDAERKVRQSEQWLSTTLRSIGDGVIATDEEGRVRFMNPVAEKLTGWSEVESNGRPLEEVFDIVNEYTRERAENPVARALREGVVVGLANHTVLIARDGTEWPIFDSAAPIRDAIDRVTGIVMVFTEITEQRRTERALAAEKELLAVTLRSIGDGVIVTDTDGRVVSMNRVAENLTGWPQADAIGQPLSGVFQIVEEKSRKPVDDPVAKVLRTGMVIGLANHTILIARDGTECFIADSGAPIRDEDGAVFGVVLVFRDVTDKMRMEDEQRRVQKLESVGTLAGGIAHDLNNILTPVLGNLSLARLMIGPESEVSEVIGQAEVAAWRARDLTKQLLTFSKGGAPVKKLTDLLSVVEDSTGLALRGSNIAYDIRAKDGLWPVEVDPGQMNQVFSNLVINARQAQPDAGTVTVTLENRTLDDDNSWQLPAGPHVEVLVEDTGTGIPERHLTRIFDPYFSTKQTGSGLGLAVCHSVVRAHGGAISVRSELGKGTTFALTLPAKSAVSAPSKQPAQQMVEGQGKILVMDDEKDIRTLVTNILTNLGYVVETAAEGRAALRKYSAARAAGAPFDGIILDLTIPGGPGGVEVLDALREIDADVKVVVCSGYSNDPVIAHYKEKGFHSAITKPFDAPTLSKVVGELIAPPSKD